MKKIVMFGAGKRGLDFLECLDKTGQPYPEVCFDNESSKWGQSIGNKGLIIQSPQNIREFDKEDYLFVVSIARSHKNEVIEQLKSELHNAVVMDSHTYIRGLAKDYYHKETSWNINYYDKIQNWLHDYRSEYEWHEKKIANFQNVDSTQWKRESEIDRLKDYDIQTNDIVIDVGCGPTLKYSNILNGVKVDYRPVDPLGLAYNQFAEKYNFKLPQKIGFAFGEHLVSFFGKEYADFILYDNSLDHAIDPLRCILEAIRVLGSGGYFL